jgi:hypothetical protein
LIGYKRAGAVRDGHKFHQLFSGPHDTA